MLIAFDVEMAHCHLFIEFEMPLFFSSRFFILYIITVNDITFEVHLHLNKSLGCVTAVRNENRFVLFHLTCYNMIEKRTVRFIHLCLSLSLSLWLSFSLSACVSDAIIEHVARFNDEMARAHSLLICDLYT